MTLCEADNSNIHLPSFYLLWNSKAKNFYLAHDNLKKLSTKVPYFRPSFLTFDGNEMKKISKIIFMFPLKVKTNLTKIQL